MKLVRTNRFKREFKKLPAHIREQTIKKLRLLAANPRHPSLRVKKIKGEVRGYRDVFEGSITMDYRFLFRIEEGNCTLLTCGTHDEFFK
jgi:mRNA-degrading endonuclease YafQ of YafQ-DinJ toxin-antitoxin module